MERHSLKHFLSHLMVQLWADYKKNVDHSRKKSSLKNVHELRVSIQRLEAVIRLSESFFYNHTSSDKFLQSLEQTRKKLGPLRDLQVEEELVEKVRDHNLKKLETYISRRKRRSKEDTKRFLKKISLPDQLHYVEKVVAKISSAEVEKTPIQMRQLMEHKVDDLYLLFKQEMTKSEAPSSRNLHQIRRIAKQLRYQEELMKSMFGRAQININKLKKVQSSLGELQDENVLLHEIDDFLNRSQKSSNKQIAVYQLERRKKHALLEKNTFRNLGLIKWQS